MKVIYNVNVITMNRNKDIIENGVVLIENGKIKEVGGPELLPALEAENRIDGQGGILIPGMVNTHTHISMIVFRSLADDVPDRLKRYLFPLEEALVDEELVRVGADYGIAEMLLSGVTTFADMYYFEDEVAQAAKAMGIRAVLGETVMNFPSPDSQEAYGGLAYGTRFIEKWKNDDRITPAIAPHAPYTNDTQHLRLADEISKKYGVPIIMHVAEMEYERDLYQKEYGMTPVGYLNEIGLLSERLLAVHAVHVTEDDLCLLKKHNVGISHNVGSNAKSAKGIAPVLNMRGQGLDVGMGTDGPMSGNTLDIMTQMNLLPKVHKLFSGDRSLFPAADVVEMATIGGAKALKMDQMIGSIEPGKRADLVLVETDSVNMQPIYDYYSALVYSANPSNVRAVWVEGENLVMDKKLVHFDLRELQARLHTMHDKIVDVAERL